MIGILIGTGSGYLISEYVNYPNIAELNDKITYVSQQYEKLHSDYTNVQLEKDSFEKNITQLKNEYDNMKKQYEETLSKQEELITQLKNLQDQYDSLLDEYESTFGEIPLIPESLPTLQRLYEFNYKGNTINLNLTIPETLYSYYASKERYSTSDYSVYVINPYDDAYLRAVVHEFDLLTMLNNYSDMEIPELIISFVQGLHYSTDDALGFDEYPKFPVETLVSGEGDCEDTSILAASLLRAINYSVALIRLPNHMALGITIDADGKYYILNNKQYYYIETTAAGWSIGEIPEAYNFENPTLYPVKEEAYLVYKWQATQNSNKVKVTVTCTNEAAEKASGVKVWAALESNNGEILVFKENTAFNLEFEESKVTSLTLTGPHATQMRLVIGFINQEGEIRNLSYSTFFTTT